MVKALTLGRDKLANYMYAILKRCVLRRDLNNDIELIALISSGKFKIFERKRRRTLMLRKEKSWL